MVQRKLLLAIAAVLFAAPGLLFAAHEAAPAAAAAVKTTSQANVQAEGSESTANTENTEITQASQDVIMKSASAPAMTRAKSSFYAGLGLALLNNKGFTGLTPKLMVGYGSYLGQASQYYGALEIGGGVGSAKLSSNYRYRVANFVNASIIPGYMLNDDTLLYGRLGMQSTHYSNLNVTKVGGVFGIGLEAFSAQHWSGRFEYAYAINKNLNLYMVDVIYRM